MMAKVKGPKKNVGVNPPYPVKSTSPVSSDAAVEPVTAATVASALAPERTGTTQAEVSAPEAVKPTPTSTPTKTEMRKTVGRPEIVKAESRPNLVPINVQEDMRRLAYFFSERRGFEAGHESEDWFKAEREIRERYHQQSA